MAQRELLKHIQSRGSTIKGLVGQKGPINPHSEL